MTEKSFVGMAYHVCPVCMAEHDPVVVLDQRLRKSLTPHEFAGWAMCEEHAKLLPTHLALVEVKEQPQGNDGHEQLAKAKRTGQIAHIERKFADQLFRTTFPPELPLVMVEEGTIDILKSKTQPEGGGDGQQD